VQDDAVRQNSAECSARQHVTIRPKFGKHLASFVALHLRRFTELENQMAKLHPIVCMLHVAWSSSNDIAVLSLTHSAIYDCFAIISLSLLPARRLAKQVLFSRVSVCLSAENLQNYQSEIDVTC